MLTDLHPIVRALDALPYPCTLVGSRGLGLHHARSDYDYLLARPDGYAAGEEIGIALRALGFTLPAESGYGPDPSADVFVWAGEPVPVDVIVVSRDEYDRRLRTIAKLVRSGDVKAAGRLYRGLKSEKAWPTFWALIRSLESVRR